MGQKHGFGLLEIVIAASIISGTLFSLAFVFLISDKLVAESSSKIRANFIAEEGLEALRLLRDASWSSNLAGLGVGTNYYLSFNTISSVWSVGTSNPGYVDGLYARTVTVENVNRDANDDIVSGGGTSDPDTKKFNVAVAWSARTGTTTVTVSTYLTDMFDN